jgi:hypothetical protein
MKLPILILSLVVIVVIAIFGLSSFFKKTPDSTPKPAAGQKVLINELPLDRRPFVAFVPHTSSRLFTFYAKNANQATEGVIDIEYQSGNLLKGAKVAVSPPISDPYVKAIILGSCSTGGKCSFDKDLTVGNLKFKMVFADDTVAHILRGDFAFVTGVNNLPDGRVIFEPSAGNKKDNLILGNSFGLPSPLADKEVLLYPIYISATTDKQVSGTMTIKQADVSEVLIWDGQTYIPLKFTAGTDQITISINQKPYIIDAAITRDDQKGAVEATQLDIIGPIVLIK